MKNKMIEACLCLTIAVGFDASAVAAPTKNSSYEKTVRCVVACAMRAVKERSSSYTIPSLGVFKRCVRTRCPNIVAPKGKSPKGGSPVKKKLLEISDQGKQCRPPGWWDVIICFGFGGLRCIPCLGDFSCWAKCISEHTPRCLNDRCCK